MGSTSQYDPSPSGGGTTNNGGGAASGRSGAVVGAVAIFIAALDILELRFFYQASLMSSQQENLQAPRRISCL